MVRWLGLWLAAAAAAALACDADAASVLRGARTPPSPVAHMPPSSEPPPQTASPSASPPLQSGSVARRFIEPAADAPCAKTPPERVYTHPVGRFYSNGGADLGRIVNALAATTTMMATSLEDDQGRLERARCEVGAGQRLLRELAP